MIIAYIRHLTNLRFAFAGIWRAIRSEKSFHLILVTEIILLIVSVIHSTPLWRIGIITFGFITVLALELINTAIERTADKVVGKQRDHLIMLAKDFAAGAILLIGIGAVILWLTLTLF